MPLNLPSISYSRTCHKIGRPLVLSVLALAHANCATQSENEDDEQAEQSQAEVQACALREDCVDIQLPYIDVTACCSPVTDCGYEAPEVDPETLMLFPQTTDFIAMQTQGDPNGRCVPEDFYFSEQPGLWKHRVEVEDGQDILITPDCQSFTLAAFVLPGCCMPDDTCGLSTDESWPTLQVLASGIDAPFTRPECVSAEELNQQFRDAGAIGSLARTRASGACDYAALAAELAGT